MKNTTDVCSTKNKGVLTLELIEYLLENNCDCETISSIPRDNFTNVNCEAFPVTHTFFAQFAYCFMFGILILFSLCGNSTVIWIILKHERMRTKTNFYLLNLAISDISITLLNTSFSFIYNLYYNWVFPDFYCKFNNIMAITPICASVFTMIIMSIDRYVAIVYPLKRRPGKRATIAIIVVVWILAFIFGAPAWANRDALLHRLLQPASFQRPIVLGRQFSGWKFGIVNLVLYLQPHTRCHSIRNSIINSELYLRTSRFCSSPKQHDRRYPASNMLALVVISFIVLWLPYNLYFLFFMQKLQVILDFNVTLYIYMNIYYLGKQSMSSCVVNPIIYYNMNVRFKLAFRYAYRWLPWIHVKKEEYQNLFMNTSRASHLTSRYSVGNTFYSTQVHHKNSEEQHSPVPL
ncbi:Tachykinin-like peptides receptor 86C [Aphelenchoides bicaudatus]|nr:Tachykinin-like peptides receptor 86C [Aphelenchoides bicaudatus]